MLIFDGLDFQTRVIKLRPRQTETCLICSKAGERMNQSELDELIDSFDYNHFCGVASYNDKTPDVKLLDSQTQRITCRAYKEKVEREETTKSHLLIDCRPRVQFKICALADSISEWTRSPGVQILSSNLTNLLVLDVPFDDLQNENAESLNDIKTKLGDKKSSLKSLCSSFACIQRNHRAFFLCVSLCGLSPWQRLAIGGRNSAKAFQGSRRNQGHNRRSE